MKTIAKLLIVLMTAASGALETAHAVIGISTRFVDVTLEFVPVGRPVNLRKMKNIPYTVRNRGDAPMEVKAEVGIPVKTDLMDGYEAIPDPTWIKLLPDRFSIPPGQTAYAEIVIEVPDKPEYVGKHYQAKIWAHSLNKGLYSAGAESRFRFSTGAGPETLRQEAKEKAMLTMDFDITPQELYAAGVEPGKKVKVNPLVPKKLKVSNRAETPVRLRFKSVPWVQEVLMPSGYEAAPDPSWLAFVKDDVTVKGERIETIDPVVTIPPGDEHHGKRYAFLVKTDVVMGVDIDMYTKVLVTVAPKK